MIGLQSVLVPCVFVLGIGLDWFPLLIAALNLSILAIIYHSYFAYSIFYAIHFGLYMLL